MKRSHAKPWWKDQRWPAIEQDTIDAQVFAWRAWGWRIVSMSLLAILACAHVPPPLVITARSMTALNDTFVGTSAAMEAAYDAHDITPEQYRKWVDFGRRFQACSAIAENLYDAAAYAKDDSVRSHAEAIFTDLETELSQYAALALQVVHPDGGP